MWFASIGSPVASLWNPRARRLLSLKSCGRRRPRPASRGFTLIEALAAIVILALSLSVLLSSHDAGLRTATALDDHLRARLLAQSLIAEWSQYRILQGPTEGREGRFTWTVSVAPFDRPGDSPQQQPAGWMLHELTVTVAWSGGRRVKLNTLRLLRVQ
jgi:general secretion pathway protein I